MYKTTIFNTPLLTPLLRLISIPLYALLGWKIVGKPTDSKRMVFIAAPHTSNWDFALMLMVVFILRLDLRWMGKDALFPWGLGWFMKYIGGIPIDRSKANNVVDQMVELYNGGAELALLNTPEGTRGKVGEWKTGWYFIAAGAGVPVQPAYVDAGPKIVGFFPDFIPTGDIDSELPELLEKYRGLKGIRAELSSTD